mmetsp:Transcript_14433/g.33683  ORF Transcript_14433/g.33683 Transcript_14433/m.33683 type:complete len:208 (-) Transcript_14433:1712-2335(-)
MEATQRHPIWGVPWIVAENYADLGSDLLLDFCPEMQKHCNKPRWKALAECKVTKVIGDALLCTQQPMQTMRRLGRNELDTSSSLAAGWRKLTLPSGAEEQHEQQQRDEQRDQQRVPLKHAVDDEEVAELLLEPGLAQPAHRGGEEELLAQLHGVQFEHREFDGDKGLCRCLHRHIVVPLGEVEVARQPQAVRVHVGKVEHGLRVLRL